MIRKLFFSLLILATATQIKTQQMATIIKRALIKGDLREIEYSLKDANMKVEGWPILTAVIIHSETGGRMAGKELRRKRLPGGINLIQFLLDKGAKIDAQASLDANTALMLAAAKGYEDIVKKLLEAGADPLIKNKKGLTALNLVQNERNHRYYAQQVSDDQLKAIEKMLEDAEQPGRLAKTVKQMGLEDKALNQINAKVGKDAQSLIKGYL